MYKAVYQALLGTRKEKTKQIQKLLGETHIDRTKEISPGARVCSIN